MGDESAAERDTIEALADAFVTRFRSGERPSVETYAAQYPELADELRELLPALVLLEQNASLDATDAFFGESKPLAALREIGDFEIVREIGRGGMGVVYEAVQQSLGRHVALKVLSSPGLLNPSHLERFRLEARAAARLHHTHIVPVFGVGEHNGLHYYAMQFIQGQSLDQVIDAMRKLRRVQRLDATAAVGRSPTLAMAEGLLSGQFQLDEVQEDAPAHTATDFSGGELTSSHGGREFYHSVARVALQVAEGLAYAHSEGILHRDIKPSNLLLDARGNVWITDFGLAKAEGTEGMTNTGDFVGTLRYMAPERLEGWSDRRSDLYSLGATAYELLTLTPFLESESRGQLVDRILHDSPTPPSKFDTHIPRDLETIVLKSITREPASRYHSADAMAEDLRLFLADRPVLARRSTPLEQLTRWCRRNPVVAALSAAVVAALLLGLATTSYFAASASREARSAKSALADAESNRKQAEGVNQFLTEEVFGQADPKRSDRAGITLVEALDVASGKIDERFPDDSELRAVVRDRLGRLLLGVDEPMKATAQLEKAVELRRSLAGDMDRKTLESRSGLGYAQYLANRFPESKATLESTYADQTKVLGESDPDGIRTGIYLALTMMEMHDPRDVEFAEKIYRQASDHLGPRNEITLDAECQYSWTLRWRDQRELALEHALLALRGLRATAGADNVRTMYAAYNYANCLSEVGRNAEAADELKQLLATRYQVLGPTHRDTLFAAWRLADVYRLIGDNAAALAVLEDVHANLKSIEALDNLRRAEPLVQIAITLRGLGRDEEARDVDAVVYRMYLATLRRGDPRLVNAERVRDFAIVLASSSADDPERLDWAVELGRAACEMTEYKDANTLVALAIALSQCGDSAEADRLFEQSLALNVDDVESRYYQALARLEHGDTAGYRASCVTMLRQFAAADAASTRYWVAWSCGLGPTAVEDLSVPLGIAKEIVAEDPQASGYKVANGILLYRVGEFQSAAEALSQAISALERDTSAAKSPDCYPRYFLAMTNWRLGDRAKSRRMLAEAIETAETEMKKSPAWNRRMTMKLFRREAESLIQPEAVPADVVPATDQDTDHGT